MDIDSKMFISISRSVSIVDLLEIFIRIMCFLCVLTGVCASCMLASISVLCFIGKKCDYFGQLDDALAILGKGGCT